LHGFPGHFLVFQPGENDDGRRPHFAQSPHVVEVAQAHDVSVSFSGDALVKFSPNWNPENLRVAVFVQEAKSREILGAASIKIKG
jgi:hypothetical protein